MVIQALAVSPIPTRPFIETIPVLKSPVIKSQVPFPITRQQLPVVFAQPALYPTKTFPEPVESNAPANAPINVFVVAPFCVSPAQLPITVL